MLEVLVISLMVGAAAIHVAFKLAPKPAQQIFRAVMAAGLNKIGLAKAAQRVIVAQAADKACGSGCDGCGTEAVAGAEMTDDGARVVQKVVQKVVHFYPRNR